MMFFGPNAASPPKNTFGTRRLQRDLVEHRHAPFVERRCRSRARSRGRRSPGRPRPARRRIRRAASGSPVGTRLRRPLSSYTAFTFSKRHAGQLAVVVHERLGHEEVEDRDALVHARLPSPRARPSSPRSRERTITFTSSPPRRCDVRQQSIAVLPPPSTITRLPIFVDVAEGHRRQPVDADVDVRRRFLAAGDIEVAPARRAAADEDRVVALGQQRLHRCRCARRRGTRRPGRGCSRLPRRSPLRAGGSAGSGVRIMPPALASPSNTVTSIAERREVARHGERRRARRRRRRCACRSSSPALRAGARGCRPCSRRRRASGGRSRPARACSALLFLDAAAPAGGLAGPVAGAPEDAGEDVGLPVDHVGVAVAALRRSGGCIREPGCGPGRPTGNRRLCGSSRGDRYRCAARSLSARSARGCRRTVSTHWRLCRSYGSASCDARRVCRVAKK